MGLFFFSRKRVMRAALLLCALLAAPVAVQQIAHRRNQKAAVHYPTEQHLGCIRVAQNSAPPVYQIIAKMVPASLARSARTSTRCSKRTHSSQLQRSKSRMDMVERKFVPPPQAAPPARTFPWTNLACTPASQMEEPTASEPPLLASSAAHLSLARLSRLIRVPQMFCTNQTPAR